MGRGKGKGLWCLGRRTVVSQVTALGTPVPVPGGSVPEELQCGAAGSFLAVIRWAWVQYGLTLCPPGKSMFKGLCPK